MPGMADWPQVSLGDHVDLLTGFPFKSAQYTDDPGDLRLLRGDNVAQGHLRWDGAKRWPPNEHQQYAKFDLHAGDVILAMDRPWIEAGLKWGWVRSTDLPCLLVQRVSRLRGINGLSTTYLRYLIGSQSFTDYIKPIVTGVNVPHISAAQIKGFRFRLPPIENQDRIASILSAYDDLIENNTRRIAILEEMARALYQEWFVHFRFPGHEHVPLAPSPLGPIPEGWEVLPFSSAAQFINGFAFKPSHWGTRGLPIVKIKELKNGITLDTPRFEGQLPAKYHVKNGDVLFSWSADLNAYMWSHCDVWLNQHLFLVQPRPGLSKLFIFYALRNRMDEFRARSAGTTMRHIKRAALDQVMLTLPEAEVRERFEQICQPMHDLVESLRAKNENLRTTRDLLLPKLISGEIDVSAVPEEPIAEAAD